MPMAPTSQRPSGCASSHAVQSWVSPPLPEPGPCQLNTSDSAKNARTTWIATAPDRQSFRIAAMPVQIEPALRNAPDRMADQAKCDNRKQCLAKGLQEDFTERPF